LIRSKAVMPRRSCSIRFTSFGRDAQPRSQRLLRHAPLLAPAPGRPSDHGLR
jgi:hypothetical protein